MNRIDFLLHTPIAHRGLHSSKVPENSIPAFKAAINGRFPIELDVHLIKSGEVVVFHDDNLKRLCGIDKEIRDCTKAELDELYLNKTRERIPLLTDVLKLVNGKVPLLIELKYDRPAGKLEDATLKILKAYKGRYALQSFNPLSIRYLKKAAPKTPRGQLSSDFKKDKNVSRFAKGLLRDLRLFSISKPDFISYAFDSLPNKHVEKYRQQGMPILGWTVRSVKDSQEALKYCDNIICEDIL